MPIAHFIAGYVRGHSRGVGLPSRRLPVPHVGAWEESEQPGDTALVRFRGTSSEIANLATTFPRVEPTDVWRPTRRKPRNHRGEIVLDGAETPTKSLARLAADVLTDHAHGELLRLVDTLTMLADQRGYVRLTGLPWPDAAKVLAECSRRGYGLDRVSTGTFPTTGILDSFAGANEAPIATNWTVPMRTGNSDMNLTSNTLLPMGVSGTVSSAYWDAATFGGDAEVYITMATKGATNDGMAVWLRVASPGGAGIDGYAYEADIASGTDTCTYYRCDNNSVTALGVNVSQEWASGDAIGGEAIGSTLQIYRKPSGGAWGALSTSRTDATYSAAGNLGITSYTDAASRTWVYDDFGGGTVVAAGGITGPLVGGGHLTDGGALSGRLVHFAHRKH